MDTSNERNSLNEELPDLGKTVADSHAEESAGGAGRIPGEAGEWGWLEPFGRAFGPMLRSPLYFLTLAAIFGGFFVHPLALLGGCLLYPVYVFFVQAAVLDDRDPEVDGLSVGGVFERHGERLLSVYGVYLRVFLEYVWMYLKLMGLVILIGISGRLIGPLAGLLYLCLLCTAVVWAVRIFRGWAFATEHVLWGEVDAGTGFDHSQRLVAGCDISVCLAMSVTSLLGKGALGAGSELVYGGLGVLGFHPFAMRIAPGPVPSMALGMLFGLVVAWALVAWSLRYMRHRAQPW